LCSASDARPATREASARPSTSELSRAAQSEKSQRESDQLFEDGTLMLLYVITQCCFSREFWDTSFTQTRETVNYLVSNLYHILFDNPRFCPSLLLLFNKLNKCYFIDTQADYTHNEQQDNENFVVVKTNSLSD
jgi:hypothetical protein